MKKRKSQTMVTERSYHKLKDKIRKLIALLKAKNDYISRLKKEFDAKLRLQSQDEDRLRGENSRLIDVLFVKDDKIRELVALQTLVDDGHAFRIAGKLARLLKKKRK